VVNKANSATLLSLVRPKTGVSRVIINTLAVSTVHISSHLPPIVHENQLFGTYSGSSEHNSNQFPKMGFSPTCAACFGCSKVGELAIRAEFPAAGETLLLDAAHPIAWSPGH
jgi:hypothetical protein